MAKKDKSDNVAGHQVHNYIVNLGEDIPGVTRVEGLGVGIEYDEPQRGEVVGGIKNYAPSKITIYRRVSKCNRLRSLCASRKKMAEPRTATFRFIDGEDNTTVVFTATANRCHLMDLAIVDVIAGNGQLTPHEVMTFQPESVVYSDAKA